MPEDTEPTTDTLEPKANIEPESNAGSMGSLEQPAPGSATGLDTDAGSLEPTSPAHPTSLTTSTETPESPPAETKLEPAPLSESSVRATMQLATVEGAFAMPFINWTTGGILTGFALHLGATPFELGLISSVPLLGQVLSPVVAWLAGRAGRRKILTVSLGLIGRILWLLAAMLPMLASAEARMPLLIALIAVSSVFQAGAGALWTAWIGDIVPPKERGRYFGFRTGLLGVIGMLANLLAGAFVDAVASPLDFQVVLVAAVVLGVISALMVAGYAEPRTHAARLHFLETFTLPFQDLNFRRVLVFSTYWTFAVLTAAPFVIPYFLKHLQMTYTQVALWSAIAATSALVLSPLWGRVIDQHGNKPVLQITTIGCGLFLPAGWLLATPDNLWPIWFGGVIDAMVWGAIGPAQFNLAILTAPQAQRSSFIAVLSAVTGIAGFLGGIFSGVLLGLYSSPALHTQVLGLEWTGYHWLFITSALLRLQAWHLLRGVVEEGSSRVRDLFSVRFGR